MSNWSVTDHVCRICFGRLLVGPSPGPGKPGRVQCADCGIYVDGPIKSLCCCGAKLANGKPAGFRCAQNANKCPESPTEIVVEYSGC